MFLLKSIEKKNRTLESSRPSYICTCINVEFDRSLSLYMKRYKNFVYIFDQQSLYVSVLYDIITSAY